MPLNIYFFKFPKRHVVPPNKMETYNRGIEIRKREARTYYDLALRYLARSPTANRVIDYFTKGPRTLNLFINTRYKRGPDDDNVFRVVMTVEWDDSTGTHNVKAKRIIY